MIVGCYIYLLKLPESQTGLAAWMVTAIVVRELIIQAVRSLIEGRGEAFGARWSGKLKTLLQCLSIAAILLCLSFRLPSYFSIARDVLTWTAVGLTLYSGAAYVAVAWPKLRGDHSI